MGAASSDRSASALTNVQTPQMALIQDPKMAGKTTKELPVDSNRGPSWQAPRVGSRQRIRSRLGSLGPAKFSAGCHNSCDDPGISGAAANLTTELVSDGLGIRIWHAQQNVPRHHQHARCAESALHGVRLMEMPAQHFHAGIVFQAFKRLYGLTLTHDREAKAGSGCLSVNGNGAGTAGSVFTSQMSCR